MCLSPTERMYITRHVTFNETYGVLPNLFPLFLHPLIAPPPLHPL